MKCTVPYTIHGCIDVEADTKEQAAEKVSLMSLKKLQKKSISFMVTADPKEVEEVKREIIDRFCNKCSLETKHDFDESRSNGVITKITVCQVCGETDVDHDPDEEFDYSEDEQDDKES